MHNSGWTTYTPAPPLTMTVCSYYLRGACKYGDRCRNEHPGSTPGNFSNQTWTSGASGNRVAVPYTTESITGDITPLKDKPLWPLSSYGPSKYEPVIISGLDESPEELRLKAVTALRAGTTDEYSKYEGERTAAADQVYANARNNVRQLYEQALKASTQAQVSASTAGSSVAALTPSMPSAFGTSATPSAFGGATTTAFGKPAFGQSAFGQPGFGGSASGSAAFNQGTQGASVFGAPAQQTSAFGQPGQIASTFGQTAQTVSAFGQPSQPSSVFGQPSAFGAIAQPTSPSGFAPPLTQASSAFEKPSQPTSAFGQPSQLTSAFAQPAQSTSALSQPSQPAFGQSSLIKPTVGTFGGSGGGGFSAFASQPPTFASTAASSPATNTMGGQSVFGSTSPVQSVFGVAPSAPKSAFGTSQPSTFGSLFGNTLSVPAVQSPVGGSPSATSPMTVTPSSEKAGLGAPDFASAKSAARMKPGADRYLDLLPDDYEEMMPTDVKAAFAGAKFEWGQIPDWIPPAEVR